MKIAVLLMTLVLMQCQSDDKETSRCDLRPDPGPCEAAIIKYYFDKNEQRCKQFYWGGCDGVVPFNSLQECEGGCTDIATN
jgi:hypothetical protein